MFPLQRTGTHLVMAYDDTRHTYMVKRGGFWIGVDRRGCCSSKGVDCDILAPMMVISQGLIELTEYSY
jgi:hypothetical protein